jgi:aminoglycoside phosphotransferase (APT) family kinase protein
MSVERRELLGEETVRSYLVGRGVVSAGAPFSAESMGGGVSNVVLAVESGGRRLVVKQALARLRVEDEWLASPQRAVTEGRALQRAAAIVPADVPPVVDIDEVACALTIERAPAGWTDWKSRLLRGDVDVAVADRLGGVLATLHAETLVDPQVRTRFGSGNGFEQLRVRPYHRTVGERHPSLAAILGEIIERMHARRRCLVHGDCSPKNVLVGRDRLWLIDFEVAHYGDPTFDVAFLASHLLLKAVHRGTGRAAELEAALAGFLAAYRQAGAHANLLDDERWLVRHVAALMLARVDGKSPVEYLDRNSAARVRTLATRWLETPPSRLEAVWPELDEAWA